MTTFDNHFNDRITRLPRDARQVRSKKQRIGIWGWIRNFVSLRGRPTLNYTAILLISAALILAGWLMVFSASAVYSIGFSDADVYRVIKRQTLALGLGLIAMLFAMRFPYRSLPIVGVFIYAGALLLNVAFIFVGVQSTNGAERWISIVGVRFQPSEVAKVAVLLMSATIMAKYKDHVHRRFVVSVPVVIVALSLAIPVFFQSDLGSATVILLIAGIMLFAGGTSLWILGGLAAIGAAIFAIGVVVAGYRLERFASWLDPWQYPDTLGHQILQAWIGLSSGGLDGIGYSKSIAKWGFLPEAHNDFIFAIIAEEAGLFGAILVVLGFCALMLFGVRTAIAAEDRFGSLLAGGITGWIVFQAMINMGIVAGLFPISGLTLPFISYGGTSLLVSMASLGILLNIARHPGEVAQSSNRKRTRTKPTSLAARMKLRTPTKH